MLQRLTTLHDAALLELGNRLETAWEIQQRNDGRPGGSRTADAYKRALAILSEIERTPATTLEGLRLRVKALAIAWCHQGTEPFSIAPNPTTTIRLAKSIVEDLLHGRR